MQIIVIFNGLGNQMSQYALYLKKINLGQKVKLLINTNQHNGLEIEKIFGIKLYKSKIENNFLKIIFKILATKKYKTFTYIPKLILSLVNFDVVTENPNYLYEDKILNEHNGINFFYGGWHSEKYFDKIPISSIYKFSDIVDAENKNLAYDINTSESVGIHVRRGDYLSLENIGTFGGICNGDYYIRAVEIMKEFAPNAKYFIFSNGILLILSSKDSSKLGILYSKFFNNIIKI